MMNRDRTPRRRAHDAGRLGETWDEERVRARGVRRLLGALEGGAVAVKVFTPLLLARSIIRGAIRHLARRPFKAPLEGSLEAPRVAVAVRPGLPDCGSDRALLVGVGGPPGLEVRDDAAIRRHVGWRGVGHANHHDAGVGDVAGGVLGLGAQRVVAVGHLLAVPGQRVGGRGVRAQQGPVEELHLDHSDVVGGDGGDDHPPDHDRGGGDADIGGRGVRTAPRRHVGGVVGAAEVGRGGHHAARLSLSHLVGAAAVLLAVGGLRSAEVRRGARRPAGLRSAVESVAAVGGRRVDGVAPPQRQRQGHAQAEAVVGDRVVSIHAHSPLKCRVSWVVEKGFQPQSK